jgi:hypothetical protein
MVAVKKGDQDAIWIASATLDRYLHKIGRPQVLGTQYDSKDSMPWTQEPLDRSLVADALRSELKVPVLDQQSKDLAEMNKKAQSACPK